MKNVLKNTIRKKISLSKKKLIEKPLKILKKINIEKLTKFTSSSLIDKYNNFKERAKQKELNRIKLWLIIIIIEWLKWVQLEILFLIN